MARFARRLGNSRRGTSRSLAEPTGKGLWVQTPGRPHPPRLGLKAQAGPGIHFSDGECLYADGSEAA